MNIFATHLLLAGIRTNPRKLAELRKAFQTHPADDLPNMLWIVVLVVGALAVLLVLDRVARIRRKPRPRRVANHLSQAATLLRLSAGTVRDLRWIASHAELSEPCALLLAPGTLAAALDRALGKQDDPPLRRRTRALAQDLFGCELPTPAADGVVPSP